MFTIGAHLSISKGFENLGLEALSIDANTAQFFPKKSTWWKKQNL